MSRTFHARRPRRADDARFLPKDAAAWRKLVARARAAAVNPKKHADALGQASHACSRAVPPPGHAIRGSVFLALVLKAHAVWAARGETRETLAAELPDLADRCELALDGAGGERRSRPRADIDDIGGED